MDDKKVCLVARILIIIAAFLAVTSPVAAQDPAPNDELHINSVGVMSGELPAPLPSMPGRVIMPDLTLPSVNRSAWPTTADNRQAIQSNIENRLRDVRSAINEQYNAARTTVTAVRSTTQRVKDFVGDPQTSVVARSDNRSVTVTGMAQEMSASVTTALGYARAVSNLGPLGLDLVFVFIALGWILFVNFASLAISVIAWFFKMLGKVLETIWKVVMMVTNILKLIPFLCFVFGVSLLFVDQVAAQEPLPLRYYWVSSGLTWNGCGNPNEAARLQAVDSCYTGTWSSSGSGNDTGWLYVCGETGAVGTANIQYTMSAFSQGSYASAQIYYPPGDTSSTDSGSGCYTAIKERASPVALSFNGTQAQGYRFGARASVNPGCTPTSRSVQITVCDTAGIAPTPTATPTPTVTPTPSATATPSGPTVTPSPVAQDVVQVYVVNMDGSPALAESLGCAWGPLPIAAPDENDFWEVRCYNCHNITCSWDESAHQVEGAYIVDAEIVPSVMMSHLGDSDATYTDSGATYGDVVIGGEVRWYAVWPTYPIGWNGETHIVTFTVDSQTVIPTPVMPTPIPTLAPYPTMTPPSTPDIAAGFSGDGFATHRREMSGAGLLPNFAGTIDQWLFYARKTVQIINAGNLLYVVGAILLAGIVVGWVIDQVKNPR